MEGSNQRVGYEQPINVACRVKGVGGVMTLYVPWFKYDVAVIQSIIDTHSDCEILLSCDINANIFNTSK